MIKIPPCHSRCGMMKIPPCVTAGDDKDPSLCHGRCGMIKIPPCHGKCGMIKIPPCHGKCGMIKIPPCVTALDEIRTLLARNDSFGITSILDSYR
jgi:hypothetical protein